MSISAEEFNRALAKLKELEAKREKKYCRKCDAEVYEMRASPEATNDLLAAGYDGTCCWFNRLTDDVKRH